MTARKKRAVRVITIYSDGSTSTVAANPAQRKKAAKKKASRKKTGDRRRRYEYVCKVKGPRSALQREVKFWALSDAAAKRYANGLLMNKYPKGTKPVSLGRTDRSRLGPVAKKKVTRASAKR